MHVYRASILYTHLHVNILDGLVSCIGEWRGNTLGGSKGARRETEEKSICKTITTKKVREGKGRVTACRRGTLRGESG